MTEPSTDAHRSPSPTSTPIVIVGGGMVGMTLALALARGGLRVTLVESAPLGSQTTPAFDGRVSAIAASSVRLFHALGLWPALKPHAQPINDILVSDGRPGQAPSPFSLHFDPRELVSPEVAAEPLGHLIENRHMRLVLTDAIANEPFVTVLAPVSVQGIDQGPASIAVLLADGRTINAALVIGADGRRSPVRRAAGIKSIGWSYDQSAIVTTIEHERPHDGVAHELFLPHGPFAILPMKGNRSSIVWTERHAQASYFLGLDDAGFDQEVSRRFGHHWGQTKAVGPRWSYPLGLHLARSYVSPRLALVGDAAHAIHPIAGQGFNLGLRDVAALAEVLIDAARLGTDLGDLHVLRRYERWRRVDNVVLAAATDGLNRLFSTDSAPIRLARDIGLGLVSSFGPAKRLFMRHAMGDVGTKPKLLDGVSL